MRIKVVQNIIWHIRRKWFGAAYSYLDIHIKDFEYANEIA